MNLESEQRLNTYDLLGDENIEYISILILGKNALTDI